MRARVLLLVCLGLNILLAMMVVLLSRDFARGDSNPSQDVRADTSPDQIKTNVVVRRQAFTWSEIESSDFQIYIANLRRIRCPEKTIRDIIVAEVDDLFAERMSREITLPDQKWWLPDPDMDVLQAGMDQVRALDAEKAQLLTHLLGPGWDAQRSAASAGAVRFDGAVLSKLSPETKATVEQIESSSRLLQAEAEERARQEGRAVDPAELARLQQETRRELAAVLNPGQLEEYLLRYSATADQMRNQLRGFATDADEFRRIFRARDPYDQQIVALTGNDPATTQRRAELEGLRDDAVRQAIDSERFALYQASQNPLFRAAREQAEQNGATPEKVLPIFRVNQAVQTEIARIQADNTLSEDQRRVALAAVQQQRRNSVERILGNESADELPQVPAQTIQPPAPVLPPLPAEAFGAPVPTKGPTYRPRR